MAIKLTDEQIDLKELAREFFEKEVRPVMAEIDARPNPEDCYPKELIRKASEIGLRTLPLPEEYDGVGADIITQAIVFSAMCEVEVGTAKILSQCWKIAQGILTYGTEVQKKKFLREFAKDHDYVFSMARTEPDSAGDNSLPYDGPEGGMKMTAVPDGDHYILKGAKNMTSLAGYSKCHVVFTRTDRTVAPRLGTTAFLVPHDLPGISYGHVHNKMGFRLYPNREVFFDNVRVPKEYMIGKINGALDIFRGGPWATIEMPALHLGMCKGIFKLALEHAKQRVQGGKPIIEHQSIGMMLSEMAMLIDSLEATMFCALGSDSTTGATFDRRMKARFAKIYPREVMVRVIVLGLDITASAGIMRDHPMEKLVRDGLSFLHPDGPPSLNKVGAMPLFKSLQF